MTGCAEVAVEANCGIKLRASPGATARTGKYPKTGFTTFPLLFPWQRRQFSYWFTAGFTMVVPSALTPAIPDCDTRIDGGSRFVNEATWNAEWALWQSTQVACRLLLRTTFCPIRSSAASWLFVPCGKGWPTFPALVYSANTFGAAGEILAPPL